MNLTDDVIKNIIDFLPSFVLGFLVGRLFIKFLFNLFNR